MEHFSQYFKHCKNREKLQLEHLIGCQGVNLFLLKYVTITTVTTASVTTVTITTLTNFLSFVTFDFFLNFVVISVFELLQFDFLVLSQFEF